MGRPSPCCYKQKLRKGLWSPEEDEKLLRHITKFGHGCWSSVPKQAGLLRCGKSCRLRWINYLRPDLKRGTFSEDEENLIIDLHKALGNKWSQIAAQLPGRTDNEIKNLWNSCLKKKLKQKGIDPVTHNPISEAENGDEKTILSNSVDSVSGLSNELNQLNVRNSNSNSTILSQQRQSLVSSMGENSNSASFNGSISFFTDRYENPQHDNAITSYRHSDLMGYVPIDQWSYGTNQSPNQNLGFTQQHGKNYSNVSTVFPVTSMAASVSPSTTTFHSQSSLNSSSFDMNRYWEMGCSNNSGSSSNSTTTSTELQSNNGVFADTNIFMDTIQEDIKWPELLRNPFFMAATNLQNQTAQQPMYNEIKSESQFDNYNTHAAVWSHNQQMQESSSQAEFIHF